MLALQSFVDASVVVDVDVVVDVIVVTTPEWVIHEQVWKKLKIYTLLAPVHHPGRSPPLRRVRHALPKAHPACVRSGSNTLATEASVNLPRNQLHHLSYDNTAYAGSDTISACHPPSLYERSVTSNQILLAGKD